MRQSPIARRNTSDGTNVLLWADGSLTGSMGYQFPGVPMGAPRSPAALAVKLVAVWAVLGEVDLFDRDELPALVKVATRLARKGRVLPGDLRRLTCESLRPTLSPVWTVYREDRDGNPTERVWRLSRLQWPELVVWDHVNHGARNGGRYEVFMVDRDDVCTTTGMAFANLAGVAEYLFSVAS